MWTAILTVVLAAFYVFLGATGLDLAGILGIVGGLLVLGLIATGAGFPRRSRSRSFLRLRCRSRPSPGGAWRRR